MKKSPITLIIIIALIIFVVLILISINFPNKPEKNEAEITNTEITSLEQLAQNFCSSENVASVFICGNHIKVISSLLGGGVTYYDNELNEISCPVVSPDAMSQECREISSLKVNCREICTKCTPGSRNAQVCITLFDPVCGNNKKTYSNNCEACKDINVDYYIKGECFE